MLYNLRRGSEGSVYYILYGEGYLPGQVLVFLFFIFFVMELAAGHYSSVYLDPITDHLQIKFGVKNDTQRAFKRSIRLQNKQF